jgi:hypothetical protein
MVINITKYNEKNTSWAPLQALEEAVRMIKAGEIDPSKVIILFLDDREQGQYDRSWLAANAKYSELVTLLETTKLEFIQTLNGEDSDEEE